MEIRDKRLRIIDSDFPESELEELSRDTAMEQLAARNSPG